MWYLVSKRDLPWRKSKDPYLIWLSEIILQQTRMDQGISYFTKFVDEFSDVHALAAAGEDQVMKLWQGLGYYSRARNLHSTAKHISRELNGKFPDRYAELIKLKGIGDYTASAIASIAFGKPHATVDGNVYRVLSRFFGISAPIDSTRGIKTFKELAQELLDPLDPGTHNQAVMEFGALTCTPRNPKCNDCVLQKGCFALQNGQVHLLPVKKGRVKVRNRYFNFLVLNSDKGFTRIRKRVGKDIWQQLYEFPMHESGRPIEDYAELEQVAEKEFSFDRHYRIQKFNRNPIIHKLSHQHIHATFWILETEEKPDQCLAWDEIEPYAMPVLLQNFVDKYRKSS